MATSEIGIKIGLAGAESVTSGLQRVGVSMGQLSGQVDTVRNALSTLAPTLAGALTVGGLVAFVRQTVNAVDAMNDLADATGASIEEISKLDQVARRNGASLDQVGGMLVKFNAQLKAADGKNGASIALEAIGLSAAKLRQLDPAEALRQTAVALAGFENDANKARITQELFGKSVREAAPFLNDLAEAGELNASVTAQQAAEADKFNKQLFAFQANAGDAARVITQELLPTLSAIAAEFNRTNAAGDTLAKFFGTGLKVVLETLAVLAANVAFVFKGVVRELGSITDQMKALAKGDFAGSSAIRKTLIEDSIQARKELDALEARIMGVQNTMRATDALRAREDRGFVPGLRSAGDIAADEARRKAAEQASLAAAKALDDEAKAIGEAIKQRERYLETLSAGTDKIAKETQALADQVAQVVLGKQAFQNIIDAREEEQAVILETQAVRALDRNLDAKEFDSLKAQAQAIRDRINARKALATATVEATDREIMARRSAFKDQDAQEIIDTERLKNSQSIIDAINRETEALQMSNIEREVTIALLAAEARGIKAGTYAYDEYAKKIREAVLNRETVRASIEQTKTIEQEWRRTSDQIGQSLTDALMQGGKSAWEYIKGLFRSMVLRPIIQAVVNPVVGAAQAAVGSALGLSAGSAAAGSAFGNAAGAAIGSAIFGSSAAYGAAIGTTSVAAGSQAAMLAAQTGSFGAAGLTATSSAAAGAGSGFMATAATAGPYVLAALAVLNAVGAFRSKRIVGGGLTGTLGEGDIQSYDLQRRGGTLFSGPEYSMVNRQTSTESAAIQSAFEALRTNAASMAEALGLSSTAVKSFTTTLGTDITQNDIGTRGIKLDGLTPEQAAKKVEEALAAANEDLAAFVLGASRTVTETLTTRIEDWEQTESGSTFRGFIDQVSEVTRTIEATGTSYARAGETNVQTLTRLASSLGTINPALELLGLNLYATSLAGADLASQLADAFGGLENFSQATAVYYAEFFTEAERTAKTTAQLTEALGGLGLALPTTRDAYRQLVEAQDLNTEAGRKAFAALVQLSGAFAQITQDVGTLAGTLAKDAVQTVAGSIRAMRAEVAAADQRVAQARQGIFDGYSASLDRLRGLLRQSASLTAAFGQSLQGLLNELSTGADLSPFDPATRLALLSRQYDTTLASARTGDITAMEQLPAIARQFVAAAQDLSQTEVEYATYVARVQNDLTQLMAESASRQASLLAQVQAVAPGVSDVAPTIASDITAALADLRTWAAAVAQTGAAGGSATDAAAAAIEEYNAAVQAQTGATATLATALTALSSLGLSDSALNALSDSLTSGASAYAQALGVSAETVQALQDALGLDDDELSEAADALRLQVDATTLQRLSTALGLPEATVAELANSLGITPTALEALSRSLGLTPDLADELQTILGLSPEERADLATSLGVSTAALSTLAAAVGVNPAALAALMSAAQLQVDQETLSRLSTALGLPEATVAQLARSLGIRPGALEALSNSLGLTPDLADELQTILGLSPEERADLATSLGVSTAALSTLAAAVGVNPAALAALMSAAQLQVDQETLSRLSTALGLPEATVAQLARSLGIRPGALEALSNSLGLTPDLADELQTILGLSTQERERLATALGISTASLTTLATSVGVNPAAIASLMSAVGLSTASAATIASLPSIIDFSPAALAQINRLAGALGLQPSVLQSLAQSVALKPSVLTELAGALGLSDAQLNDLGLSLGYSAATADALAQSLGLGEGLTRELSQSLGLSSSAIETIRLLSGAIGNIPSTIRVEMPASGAAPEPNLLTAGVRSSIRDVAGTGTEQEKAALYRMLRLIGLGDAVIRATVDEEVGPQDDNAWAYLRRIAGFKQGGLHAGGWRVVGEAGPELAYTGPERIFSNPQSKALMDTSRLEQKIEALQAELALLRAEAQSTAVNTAKSADLLQRATDGGQDYLRVVVDETVTL